MGLTSLELRDFRCIEQAELQFDPRCTLITGENASGKTSLLEAIHVLSCGHSFRTPRLELLVRQGAPDFLALGRIQKGERTETMAVQGSKESTEARISGRPARGFAELAAVLPVQVIDPEIHRLLEDGPKLRRRFLDWGVFHVEPQFVETWRRYQRALRQRNAALKLKEPQRIVSSWDVELEISGALVALQRSRYLIDLNQSIAKIASSLLELQIRVEHRQGWTDGQDFGQALRAAWSRDLRYGLTTVGPHRADLVVLVEGVPAKERVSRGQQKLLAAALVLAQLSHRSALGHDPACLLIDDPAAELDVDNLEKLMREVARTPAQLVLTALDIQVADRYISGKLFHVKRGHVTPVL